MILSTVRALERDFYGRDACGLARELLGKLLLCDGVGGRIVEVEAYGGADDPGSHAYRGRTRRNASMFGPPGHLYVYFIYGVHWCANVVCGAEGVPGAVLVRALAPTHGVDAMRRRRARARRERDLCSGPARLCQALAIDGSHDGADLVSGHAGVRLIDDGTAPPARPRRGPRIGLAAGAERPWRWYVAGDPNLSRPG
jgi:DNA-3-methyladenine glycosylase